MARKKSNNRFVAEETREGWAFFEKTNTWRRTPSPSGASPDHFPREWGDWVAVSRPKGWQPDESTRLNLGSSLHAEPQSGTGGASGAGSGGGMKTGAGGKPQPYGWHGYYGETGGGSSPGPVYRGKVTPPNKVRGPVTPLAKAGKAVPAPQSPLNRGGRVAVSTRNDETNKPDPKPEALRPETRAQVQATLDTVPGVNTVNMNSAYRSGDPAAHGEGRAVDINEINGQSVAEISNPNVPAEQRAAMRQRLEEIRAAAEANPDVEAYIDPLGGFFRPKDANSKEQGREATAKEIHDHRHHIHITIRKILPVRP